MKRNKITTYLVIFMIGISFLIPCLVNIINVNAIGHTKIKITWYQYYCTEDYDADNNGNFYIQAKFYKNDNIRYRKTVGKTITPTVLATPDRYIIIYNLQEGTNLGIRLMENDFMNADDCVVTDYIKDQGYYNDGYYKNFYISASFESFDGYIYSAYNSDWIKISIINLG